MGGSKEAAAKRRATMIVKYGGLDNYLKHQRKAAAGGGAKSGKTSPTNFANNRKLASRAGKSRRTNVDQPESVRRKQYRNEPDPGDMPAMIQPDDMSSSLNRAVARDVGEAKQLTKARQAAKAKPRRAK